MSTTISIIIRTYNEERYLQELLDIIAEQETGSDYEVEVIIVDSGSTDRTIEISSVAGARVVTIKKEEFSFGRSLNIGCKVTKGEYLVFISGHCIPKDKHWLTEMVAQFSSPNVAIVYGRQIGGEDTKFSEHRIFSKYFPDREEPSQSEIFCNNANSAIRKSVWQDYPFDEELTGLEDMALGKQVVNNGMVVNYAHRAVVYHLHHETWGQVKNRYEREAIALEAILPNIQLGCLDSIRYFIVAVLSDMSDAISERKILREFTSLLVFRFCQFYGAWRGHRQHRNLSRKEKERYFYP